MTRAGAVECLLFVAGEPLTLADLAKSLECDEINAEAALRELQIRLRETQSGLQLMEIAGGFQLSTRPEYSDQIARLVTRAPSKLSRAALETAAIVAYRQPITQPEIEAVRGVGCGSVLETLGARGLIQEVGRKQTLGRPILYATTQDFLHYFGLSDLGELPPLEEIEEDEEEPKSPALEDDLQAGASLPSAVPDSVGI